MALIVDVGDANPLAESLCSVAFADSYHGARGVTTWATMMVSEKEAALRRATDYMAVYSQKWTGLRKTTTQALDWPRNYVPRNQARPLPGYYFGGVVSLGSALYLESYYANDAVPLDVKQACAALALKAAGGELQADEGPQVRSEQIGPISVVYEPGARQSPKFAAIDRMLAPFLLRSQPVQLFRA